MSEAVIGVLTGIVLGAIALVVLYACTKKTSGKRNDYDERQLAVRGIGYKYGFYTVLVTLVIRAVLSTFGTELPINEGGIAFIEILIGVLVVVVYSIWNNAYWGVSSTTKSYKILIAVCTVVNLLVAFGAMINGEMIVDGKAAGPFVNLVCGLMFLVIAIVTFIKSRIDLKNNEMDEED